LCSISALDHFGIERRGAVLFQNADEQPMRTIGPPAVVRNLSGGNVRARDIAVKERAGRARRLEPMKIPEAAQRDFCVVPSIPLVVDANQHSVKRRHRCLLRCGALLEYSTAAGDAESG